MNNDSLRLPFHPHPPALTDGDAAHIPVLAYEAFGMWPHFFTNLARKYDVPLDFLVTLLFLWDATMGSQKKPHGRLSLTQFPKSVRQRERNKYLAALVAVDFFEVEKSGQDDTRGSLYSYQEEVQPEEWDRLFQWVAFVRPFPGWDKITPKQFGAMARRAVQGPSDEEKKKGEEL